MTASSASQGAAGKVVVGMTMSLDGFVNDRNGGVGRLYPDLAALRETEELRAAIAATGAVVMGRRAYDMAEGDFTGYEFQAPIFVLSHRVPEKAAKGENEKLTFAFVGGAIEAVIERAKAAAGDRWVSVIGGARTAQQVLRAGLADELHIDLAPVLLGGGLRLFEHLDGAEIGLERIRVAESAGVTHLRYRVVTRQE